MSTPFKEFAKVKEKRMLPLYFVNKRPFFTGYVRFLCRTVISNPIQLFRTGVRIFSFRNLLR